MAAMDTCNIGLAKDFSGHQLGIGYTNIQGRDGVLNDNQYTLSYSYTFGSSQNTSTTSGRDTLATA
jgi:hypothetical protein